MLDLSERDVSEVAEGKTCEIVERVNESVVSISTANTISETDLESSHNEVLCSDLTKARQSRCFSAPVSFKNTNNICMSEYPASVSTENSDREGILQSCPMSPDFARSKSNFRVCDPPSPGSMETPLQHGPKDFRKDADSGSASLSPDKKKRKVQRPLHELSTSDQGFSGCLKKVRVQLDPANLETEDCNAVIEEVMSELHIISNYL
jgi:hypothetical protein